MAPFSDLDVRKVSPEPNRKHLPSVCFKILESWILQVPEHGSGSGHWAAVRDENRAVSNSVESILRRIRNREEANNIWFREQRVIYIVFILLSYLSSFHRHHRRVPNRQANFQSFRFLIPAQPLQDISLLDSFLAISLTSKRLSKAYAKTLTFSHVGS